MFTNGRDNQYTNVMIAKRMKATCEDAGIPYGDKLLSDEGERIGVVFHCFRLTRTTRWVEAGFSDEIIRRATGHKSLEAYRDYVRLDHTMVMRLVREKVHKTAYKLHNSKEEKEDNDLKSLAV